MAAAAKPLAHVVVPIAKIAKLSMAMLPMSRA